MSPRTDPLPYERLVRECLAAVYRAAFRVLRREAEARDVTQQVFLDVLEGKVPLEEARDRTRMLCWRAVRRALSELRKEDRGRRLQAELESHAMIETTPEPQRSVERQETSDVAWQMVEAMPDPLRLPLVLRYREGFTQKAIAEALEVSEPTINVRLKKGLDHLRRGLSRVGVAAAPAALPGFLRGDEGIVLPAGLETEVLGLASGAASASVGLASGLLWSALLGIALVTGVGTWWLNEGATPPEPPARISEAGLLSDGPAVPRRSFPRLESTPYRAPHATSGTPGERADAGVRQEAPTARIVGRIVSFEGRPLFDVVVRALSFELRGKGPVDGAETRTDASGAFELSVPALAEDRRGYQLQVVKRNHFVHVGREVWVRSGQQVELGVVRLQDSVRAIPGHYELDLLVVDPAGIPCDGARVSLRRLEGKATAPKTSDQEIKGRTDGSGRVRLRGKFLGGKHLTVVPADERLAPFGGMLTIDAEGRHRHRVVLVAGQTLSGTLTTVDGEVPTGQILIVRQPGRARWIWAKVDASGRWEAKGLTSGDWSLAVQEDLSGRWPRWSPLGLNAVPAGTSGLAIRVKALHDARNLGTHAAELHGRVVDPAGHPLAVDALSVSVRPVPVATREALARDVLPDLLPPFMGQVAASGAPLRHPPEEFHRGGLDAGAWVLRVQIPGFATRIAGPFVLRDHEIKSGIEIRLDRGRTVKGVVLDAAGLPVAGAFVYATGSGEKSALMLASRDESVRKSRGRGFLPFGDVVRTDAAGRFVLPRVPRDLPLRLAAVHPDHRPAFSAPLAKEGSAAIEFRLVAR